MSYVELHACSAFSFLRGGSFPEQLAETAGDLKMPAMALLDRNGVYGAQRFSVAAREHGEVRPIVGAELTMEDGSVVPVLVKERRGYRNLCELLTEAHLRSPKGECAVQWNELPEFAEGLVALLGSARLQRAGDDILSARTFSLRNRRAPVKGLFRQNAESPSRTGISTLQACAPQGPADRAQLLIDAFRRDNVYVEVQRHFVRGE